MFCSQNCEEKTDTASYCKIGKSQTRLNFRIIAYRFSFIAKLFYLHGLISIKRSAHESEHASLVLFPELDGYRPRVKIIQI